MTTSHRETEGEGDPGPIYHSSQRPFLIRGARAVLPREVKTTDLLFEGGRIRALGEGIGAPGGSGVVDASGLWILPGWIDIQANDMEWLSFGRKEPSEHARRIREVLRCQVGRGVTGLVLATLAAPLEEIVLYLKGMQMVRDAQESPLDGAFAGGLVEGTFMNPRLCGAHNPAFVLPPKRETLDRLLDAGGVRLLNIAPEMAPEALELIAYATARGVVVGAGHAMPHAERFRAAVDAGLKYVIHLGNGPTGSSFKNFHDGGMLEEALRNDRVAISIIVDGIHVDPRLVRDWIARKEIPRVIGMSDAGFACGTPSGEFEVHGVRGAVSEDGRYLQVVPAKESGKLNPLSSDFGPLFGSAIGMREVFENLLNFLSRDMGGVCQRRHAALDLPAACSAASAMTSANPAALLGSADRGRLDVGARADAVLLEIRGDPGKYRVKVRGTWTG